MIIAVDFDGTCVTHEFPRVGAEIGAAEVLKELTDKGHKIILFTMRSHQLDGAEETEEFGYGKTKPAKLPSDGLQDAIDWFKKHDIPLFGVNENPTQKEKRLNLEETGLIVSGGFGNAIMTMYGDRLIKNFVEVIVTNGGIRLGNKAAIFKDRLFCKNWIFIDDSYYLGRTKAGISVVLRKIRPDASLYETYVIYDGSMGRADKLKSMYRYGK